MKEFFSSSFLKGLLGFICILVLLHIGSVSGETTSGPVVLDVSVCPEGCELTSFSGSSNNIGYSYTGTAVKSVTISTGSTMDVIIRVTNTDNTYHLAPHYGPTAVSLSEGMCYVPLDVPPSSTVYILCKDTPIPQDIPRVIGYLEHSSEWFGTIQVTDSATILKPSLKFQKYICTSPKCSLAPPPPPMIP